MSNEGLPLAVLFRRGLESASKAYLLPTVQKETQELIQSSVSDLRRVSDGIESLALFSSNESVDDLATGDIVYLLVPSVLSEMLSRVLIENEDDRQDVIHQSQVITHSILPL
jgi:immunoglobulin-binding protein 1